MADLQCDQFRPGRDLPKDICGTVLANRKRCMKPRSEHHPGVVHQGIEAPTATVPLALPSVEQIGLPGDSRNPIRLVKRATRKVVGVLGPLTPEIFAERAKAGFTEFLLRNPNTDEEYICQVPIFPSTRFCEQCEKVLTDREAAGGVVCSTCGTMSKPPVGQPAPDPPETLAQAYAILFPGLDNPSPDDEELKAAMIAAKARGVPDRLVNDAAILMFKPSIRDAPKKLVPHGAVCPKCGAKDVEHHGYCGDHDPNKLAASGEERGIAEDSQSTVEGAGLAAGPAAPPAESLKLHKCEECGFETNRAADLHSHKCPKPATLPLVAE